MVYGLMIYETRRVNKGSRKSSRVFAIFFSSFAFYNDVYVDVISGATSSRPEFDRLLNDMRQYRFNCILVTKLDRIGRSLAHLLSLFDEFKRKSVSFIASTQNIDTTTASGTLLFQIMGAFAEFERNIISERTKEGLVKARNVGKRGKDKKPRKKRGGLRKAVYL